MGQNLATLLAPEGITVNIVSHPMSLHDLELTIQVSPAMIGSTGMIPPPKSEYVVIPHLKTLQWLTLG